MCIGWENGICQNWNLSESVFCHFLKKLKIVRIGNCQNWKLSELEIVRIGNCQNWKLSELEFVRIGICHNWKLSESEFVRIGNCQNRNLSELEFVRIGICQNWNLSASVYFPTFDRLLKAPYQSYIDTGASSSCLESWREAYVFNCYIIINYTFVK